MERMPTYITQGRQRSRIQLQVGPARVTADANQQENLII